MKSKDDHIPRRLSTGEAVDPTELYLPGHPLEQEVERLHALSKIAEVLNKSVDIRQAVENTLSTLLSVLNLQTGWVSLRADSHLNVFQAGPAPEHGFILAAASGLPPSLGRENQRFLRQPPACQCQRLLSEGRLTQAVNIVECTRLHDAHQQEVHRDGLRYHATVPLISGGQPVGLINAASDGWRFLTQADLHFLSAVAAQLVVALERAYLFEQQKAQSLRLQQELKMARLVQESLMPRRMPDIPGYSLASAWCPALEVGGDFYDIFPLPNDCWGLVIGDVADKGTASALLMTLVHGLIRSEAQRHCHPAETLSAVNQSILRQCSAGIFVTAFMAVLDPHHHMLYYANGGHPPPMLRRAAGQVELLNNTGAVLGVLDKLQLTETTTPLQPGDALLLYTDGVPETYHPQDQAAYGLDRLKAQLTTASPQPQAMLAYLEAGRLAFSGNTPQQDDVTYLVLAREI